MKKYFIFVENNKESSELIKYFVRKGINHQIILDEEPVDKLKKTLNMSTPILIVREEETKKDRVLMSLKELEECVNGQQ
jgi:hypothetical protein